MPGDGRVNTRTLPNRDSTPMGTGRPKSTVGHASRDARRLIPEHLVDFQNPRHIGHGLGKRRDLAPIAVDRILARIVCGERESYVLAEAVDEKLQVARAGMD